MKTLLQPAYVLHGRPYRDSSVLLDLFTAEQGRVALVGRGLARKRRGGSLGALLQPFQPLLVSYQGRGELLNLTDAESAGALKRLNGDALMSAFYLNELLLRLTQRGDPQPTLFSRYSETLTELVDSSVSKLADTLRRFEFFAMDALGYGIDLHHDAASGAEICVGELYLFTPEYGLSRANSRTSGDELCFWGEEVLAIAEKDYGRARASAKRLARLLLQPHLGDKPLRSRGMFKEMRKLQHDRESGA
ncbi:MAG: DNA repair protein RecO [Pseudomonadota bacterium]